MTSSARKLGFLLSLSGFLAVGLGAFGAHGLKTVLSVEAMLIWEKAVHYQFFHTLAGLAALIWLQNTQNQRIQYAIIAFLIGIVCFSGSLYVLACKEMLPLNLSLIGPITPIGGIFFMMGWGVLMWQSITKDK